MFVKIFIPTHTVKIVENSFPVLQLSSEWKEKFEKLETFIGAVKELLPQMSTSFL